AVRDRRRRRARSRLPARRASSGQPPEPGNHRAHYNDGHPQSWARISGLAGFERIWLLFVFHRSEGWKPLVRPPRGGGKRGVLATRSPHRPNAIGLSAVELVAVEERALRVRGVDLLDGTPILDIKPYVPYADAFP